MTSRDNPLLGASTRPALTLDRSSSYGSAMALEICGGFFSHVIFAVCFAIFLSDPSYYTPLCADSLVFFWAEANLYYFIAASVLTTIVSPLMIWISRTSEHSNRWCYNAANGLLNLIRFGVGLMAILLYVGLCVSYSRLEGSCGRLGSLIFAYIIIVSATILVGCLILIGLGFMVYLHQRSGLRNERTQELQTQMV